MARSTFKFRLQRLLDVRELREKQAQQELQARRAQLATEQAKLAELHDQEQKLQDRLKMEQGDVLDIADRVFTEHAIKLKIQEQQTQQGEVQKAEQRIVEQQEVVRQAGIDVKALEKLKEKQREEHRLEELRAEGVFLDDLAGQGFLRRRTLEARRHEEEDTPNSDTGAA